MGFNKKLLALVVWKRCWTLRQEGHIPNRTPQQYQCSQTASEAGERAYGAVYVKDQGACDAADQTATDQKEHTLDSEWPTGARDQNQQSQADAEHRQTEEQEPMLPTQALDDPDHAHAAHGSRSECRDQRDHERAECKEALGLRLALGDRSLALLQFHLQLAVHAACARQKTGAVIAVADMLGDLIAADRVDLAFEVER